MKTSATLESITPDEVVLLTACEQTIADGMESFKSVGRALVKVRDSRLYRATHATFEDYCRERWQMDRTYAHRIIEGAKLAEEMLPIGNIPTESAARELAKVEPEHRAEVLQAAAASGKVTAKSIREAEKPNQEHAQAPAPIIQDAQTRAFSVSLKLQAMTDEMKDRVAGLNPSRAELVQAALAFRKLGNELEKSAELLPL
jgi:hypothetical protein